MQTAIGRPVTKVTVIWSTLTGTGRGLLTRTRHLMVMRRDVALVRRMGVTAWSTSCNVSALSRRPTRIRDRRTRRRTARRRRLRRVRMARRVRQVRRDSDQFSQVDNVGIAFLPDPDLL